MYLSYKILELVIFISFSNLIFPEDILYMISLIHNVDMSVQIKYFMNILKRLYINLPLNIKMVMICYGKM